LVGNMTYTDEDVKKAVDIAMDKFGWYFYPHEMREFLDAVAPMIAERAVVEYESRNECMCGNPYNNRFAWHTPGECSG
jgi:hypothetical protein